MNKKISVFTLYGLIIAVACSLCFLLCACGEKTTAESLCVPENLRITGGRVLAWDNVENAIGYVVCYNNAEYETSECSYELPMLAENEAYKVEVMAVGDGIVYLNSDWKSFTFISDTVKEHGYDESGLEYSLLEDRSGYEVSRGKSKLKGFVELPDYFRGLPVKSIAIQAFFLGYNENNAINYDIGITGFKLPRHLEVIENNAFGALAVLEEITVPESVTNISKAAFSNCIQLKRVALPQTLKVIPSSCFENCPIQEILFPQDVEEIGEKAFSCPSRIFNMTNYGEIKIESGITDITVPKSIKRIGDKAFYGCEKLKNIRISEPLEYLGREAFYNTAWLNGLPEGFAVLGDDILYCYKGELPKNAVLTIPEGIKYIAGGAFAATSSAGISGSAANNTSVVISDGVKFIGEEVFYGCLSLTSVKLPGDLLSIPKAMFAQCENLVKVEMFDDVTEIGQSAFSFCGTLKEISVSDSLNVIGGNAFYGCTNLLQIEFPYGVKAIGSQAFGNCKALREVILPESVEELERGVFFGCTGLQKVILPNKLKVIKSNTFQNCTALKEIDIPASVKSIGSNAFYRCGSLTKVDLHVGLEAIGTGAFCACTALTHINLPYGLNTIEKGSFRDCSSLHEIVIPKTVVNFGDKYNYNFPFSGCDNMQIYYEGTEKEWESLTNLGTLTLPEIQKINVYFYSETAVFDGRHWRYTEAGPTIWTE